MNRLLDFPDLALWSSSVGRRVHDDRVVVVTSADLALDKFGAVIHKPADRLVRKAGHGSVLFCPVDHAFGCIDMCDACACCGRCERCASRVGEQVQHFNRAVGTADQIAEPVPVRCLLREKAGVFEAERFQAEGQVFIVDLPLLRQMEKLPFSAALAASVIMTVFLFPARIFFFRVPDDLRVWSYQKVISPPLQFSPPDVSSTS